MKIIISKESNEPTHPSLVECLSLWLKIGCISFGGPAAQIALMYREFVEEKKWLSEKQYLSALNFCMLLPGPEAMQLATYVGWRLHGVFGGLMAGLLFILPGAMIILCLAISYSIFSSQPFISAIFLGVKAAVVIIVIDALRRLLKRALREPQHWGIALLAFIAIFFFALPYPLIIVIAAVFGFFISNKTSPIENSPSNICSPWRSVLTMLVGVLIWAAPLFLLVQVSAEPILADISLFFSKLAVVTFGGAYSVLSYMGQDVVTNYQWLNANEMLDGLGLAETTPGPLILVTEFVGYLSAYHQGGLVLGLLGAIASLWATFVPCFIWIFVGAPYIDWIASQPRLQQVLAGITAAVVGVILNLSIWFALHVFFADVKSQQMGWLILWQPQWASIDWAAVFLALIGAVLLFVLRWSVLKVLFLLGLLGVAFFYSL